MTHLYFDVVIAAVRRSITKIALSVFLTLALLFSSISFSNAQPVQLVFQSPSLESGSAGADGAVYRFSNVTTGIDALVTIAGRSDLGVVLNNIDLTSSGSGDALQPQVGYFGNNANKDWYMDLLVHFVAAGTNDELPAGSGTIYKATAFDIDGNGTNIREYVQAFAAASVPYTVDPATQLTVSPVTVSSFSGTEFLGPIASSGGINTADATIAATLSYTNQNYIGFRIGARNQTSTSGFGASREYSILFNNFLYIAPGPLPVDLISFTAKLKNNASVLDWVTANEKDFSHFTIQRGTDGSSFTDIGTVAGKQASGSANTSYSYTDNDAVQSAIVYYRLKMVDIDGKFKYSAVKLVNRSQAQNQASILVYPNPVVSELRVTIPNSWQGKTVSYTIYGSNGNAITQRVINSAGQTELFNLSGASAGLYTIRVTKDTETIVKQFVKQN